MGYQILDFKTLGDNRGSLVALEADYNAPFHIKRVYYIFDTKNDVIRGCHAHINLKQIAIAVKGFCTFIVDDGMSKKEILLNNPNKGLFIEGLIWREMKDFSEDCVLLVVASEHYDEADYIRDYDKFLEAVKNDS